MLLRNQVSREIVRRPIAVSLHASVLLAILAIVPCSSATASGYRVYLVNFTSENITGIWGAQGCAGIEHGKTEVCDSQSVAPGEMKSYHYKWGATAPTVYAYVNSNVSVPYGFASGNYWGSRGSALQFATPANDTETTAIFSNDDLWEFSDGKMGWDYDSLHPDLGYIYGTNSNANTMHAGC
ncbi:MAG: hypothetical protein GY792_36375 [Gammaproteobacteria bacterium]|nr:hypothetical protein [Gammaproteobacteria bacterium]